MLQEYSKRSGAPAKICRQVYWAGKILLPGEEAIAKTSGLVTGERGGKLLPKLLKPGELASKEQKETFKKEAGIDGLGDVGRLIEVRIGASSLPLSPLQLPSPSLAG